MRRIGLKEAPLEGRALLAQVKQVYPGARWARPRFLRNAVMARFVLGSLPLRPKIEVYISPDEKKGYEVHVIAPDLHSESLALGHISKLDRRAGPQWMSSILVRAARGYSQYLAKLRVMEDAFWDAAAKSLGIIK